MKRRVSKMKKKKKNMRKIKGRDKKLLLEYNYWYMVAPQKWYEKNIKTKNQQKKLHSVTIVYRSVLFPSILYSN
jgi:hypothetical protein